MLRVAIVTTNDPKNYSGGRYHGLMLAYAAAAAGLDATMITDHKPAFDADLAPLSPGRPVRFAITKDFVADVPDEPYDLVVIVPTGVFHPEFYEPALAIAGRAGAGVALVNFESGDWFNSLAPEPKDVRLWTYWRRVLVEGGLCLSSARESARWARGFYGSRSGAIRHEVWNPPINSTAARAFDKTPKDGSVLAFVRPGDKHKGSQDLFQLRPELFKGRILNLVSGRDLKPEFEAQAREHFRGADVRFHLRVSDRDKFALMAPASVVLFPSRFEGYGYPPVEAAYCGAESVCFDLPVLRETVGAVAHIAPMDDFGAFNEQLAAALKTPERRMELRQAVARIAPFEVASTMFAEIVTRSLTVIPRLQPKAARVLFGPFRKTDPLAPSAVDRAFVGPATPPVALAARQTAGGDLALSLEAVLPRAATALTASVEGGAPCQLYARPQPISGGWTRWTIHVVAPPAAIGKIVRIEAAGLDREQDILVRVEAADARAHRVKSLFGLSEMKPVEGGGQRLRGWVMAEEPIDAVHASVDGKTWFSGAVETERRDVFERHPGYPSKICGFVLTLADGVDPKKGVTLLLERKGTVVDALGGWTPSPRPLFPPKEAPAPKAAAAAPKPAAAPAAAPAEAPPLVHPIKLDIQPTTDTYWNRGVLRKGDAVSFATVRVLSSPQIEALPLGVAVRLASGALRRVARLNPKGRFIEIGLDGPVDPALDGGKPAETLADVVAKRTAFSLSHWSDKNWLRGVWNVRGPNYRCAFFVRLDAPGVPRLRNGMLLSFATSGLRRIVETKVEGKNLRVFLDSEIRPFGDGAPHEVEVVAPLTAFEDQHTLGVLDAPDLRWSDGRVEDDGALAPRMLAFEPTPVAAALAPGAILRLATGATRRVAFVEATAGAVFCVLDRPVAGADRPPAIVTIADPGRLVDGFKPAYAFKHGFSKGRRPLYRALIDEARRRRVAPGLVSPARADQPPRALVLSLVAHQPANQGNRVVTRNLILHLVSLGFKVDLVIQNWVDPWFAIAGLERHVRIIVLPFPDWQNTPAMAARRQIEALARELDATVADPEVARAVEQATKRFHPYAITDDSLVEITHGLMLTNRYAAIVVNYTHLIRAVREIERLAALPPTIVLTHDALSRLPMRFGSTPIDTAYRACAPEQEREVLDDVPGMTVVAISKNEADYFKEIGVRNPIIVTECDTFEEAVGHQAGPENFAARTLIFHGSANPMNVAGLGWFIDNCWGQIREAAPDAKLVVCGRISDVAKSDLPGLVFHGEVERDVMYGLLSKASVAINPCVAGTGLKIKTVEAAALGLPSVCLPNAVEGLEDVAQTFAFVVQTPQDFIAACVRLLTEEPAWRSLNLGALDVARRRFSQKAVYRDFDRALIGDASRPPRPDRGPAGAARHSDAAAADALLDRSAAVLAEGDGWAAAVHASAAAALAPAEAAAYALIGDGFATAGLMREAAEAFLQALMLRPTDVRIIDALEAIYVKLSDQAGQDRAKALRKRLA